MDSRLSRTEVLEESTGQQLARALAKLWAFLARTASGALQSVPRLLQNALLAHSVHVQLACFLICDLHAIAVSMSMALHPRLRHVPIVRDLNSSRRVTSKLVSSVQPTG